MLSDQLVDLIFGRVESSRRPPAPGPADTLEGAPSAGVPGPNQAVIEAARLAAPFPAQPGGAMKLQLVIAFELN